MANVRCVIAEIPQTILAEILQQMADESGVIEVVDRLDSIDQLSATIRKTPVDVLILGMKHLALPAEVSNCMRSSPNVPIVALGNDGRRLAVYLDNAGRHDIVRIISALPLTHGGLKF